MKNEKWEIIAKDLFPKQLNEFKKFSGRRPDGVVFSTIEKDVLRRDFKYNALYYDIDSGKIIDLVGGLDDLNNKITSTVGNPLDRFIEDPLRILRFFRFSNRF